MQKSRYHERQPGSGTGGAGPAPESKTLVTVATACAIGTQRIVVAVPRIVRRWVGCRGDWCRMAVSVATACAIGAQRILVAIPHIAWRRIGGCDRSWRGLVATAAGVSTRIVIAIIPAIRIAIGMTRGVTCGLRVIWQGRATSQRRHH